MPNLYIYLGITIMFYSNEHEPIHVHGKYQGCESKAEIIVQDGMVKIVKIKSVRGKRPLNAEKLRLFKRFLEIYADGIIKKWTDYFVFHKKVNCEAINRRIK